MTDQLDRLKAALADRYAIERELGRGGMATVYLAEDLKHHRYIAIKVLDPELARVLGAERFLREVEVTAKLTHPHILTLIDSGEADGFLYYVMPYIEGETLRERMDREGQLPLDDALQITKEVATALSYAHSHDVIHRDIKPENVLLSAGEAVVADFGIARAITEAGGEHLTETGISIGTPAYMSPEQASGAQKLDGRSDVYSLGCVLYEMLAGEPPFTGPTGQAVLAKKLSEVTPRVSVVREKVPPNVEAAIDKALAKAPADRFGTAQGLHNALSGPAEPVTPLPVMVRFWGRPGIWVGLAVVLIAVGGVSWMIVGSGEAGGPRIQSIIVLPVEVSTGDSASIVLAEALSHSINAALGDVERIVVKGHYSATRYLDEQMSDAEIMRDLGVDALLHTAFLQHSGRVQVYAELYDADAQMVWSDDYDYPMGDILSLPSAVARDIAHGIEIDLTSEDEAQLAARDTVNPEAYEEYAWGNHFWTQRGDGLRRGKQHFERAIALDSGFSDAWAGLADTYNLLGFYHLLPPNLAYPRGRVAAQRALLLDSTNARAHTALAFVYAWYDLDPAASVLKFEEAMRADPEYWIAYAWFSPILQLLGRTEESVLLGDRAVESDPRYPIVHMGYGWRDYLAREFEQAVQRFQRILDLTPESPVGRRLLGQALTELDRIAEAESQLQRALAHPAHSSRVEGQLAYLLATTGRQDSARTILRDLTRQYEEQVGDTVFQAHVSALDIALVHMGLAQPDSAFQWLGVAFEEKVSELLLLPLDPRFDVLRSDPRFSALVDSHFRSGEFSQSG